MSTLERIALREGREHRTAAPHSGQRGARGPVSEADRGGQRGRYNPRMTQSPPAADLNPYRADVIECPYPMYERMREAGVYYLESGDVWIVTRWEDVQFVLKRADLFSNLVGMDPHSLPPEQAQLARQTGALPASDPPEHTHYRRLAGPWLSKRGVESFEPNVYRVIDGLIDRFIDDGRVELARQFSTPLTVLVFVELMGIIDEDIPRVTDWVDDTIELMGASFGLVEPKRVEELTASGEQFRRYLLNLARERRQNPRDDMLTHLVTAPMPGFEGRTLHEQELQGMLVTLLMGGTETTLNMVDSGMWLLLEHPDLMAELRADHALIPNFVEEALRIESPVQQLQRRAIVDAEIGGVAIPAGARLSVFYAAANRDPNQWAAPDRFDIHREEAKRHVGFGAGVHYCIGAPLARMEGRIAFERLLTRLTNIRYSPDTNDFRHGPNHVIRGFRELWLDFDKARS